MALAAAIAVMSLAPSFPEQCAGICDILLTLVTPESPTRLASACADAILASTISICRQSSARIASLSSVIISVLDCVARWFGEHRPLYVLGVKFCLQVFRSWSDELDITRLAAFWCEVAPWLNEDTSYRTEALIVAYEAILKLLAQPDGADKDVQLVCSCLIAGRVSSGKLRTFIDATCTQAVGVLQGFFLLHDEHVSNLAASLLRIYLFSDLQQSSAGPAANLMLESVLQERDTPSVVAVAFAAQIVSNHPALLKDVFQRLDDDDAIVRRNVLSIIESVLQLDSQAIAGEMSRQLAELLLQRLGDDELQVRVGAAALFARLDAEFIFPRLLPLLLHKDARRRAAADEAIVTLICAHDNPCGAIMALLECVRQPLSSQSETSSLSTAAPLVSVSSPADISAHAMLLLQQQQKAEQQSNTAPDEQLVERVLRLSPKWSEQLHVSRWPAIIQGVVRILFAAPSDTIVVQFMSSLSAGFSAHASIVVALVLDKLQSQAAYVRMRVLMSYVVF
eukprot:TRINITY_DN2869_c0_g1_i1.p1 TRINITY_DN2869_c0_g1~~TRINITY_DN2869_c0_g1_i1.p1  ORF type:complete len:591 (-),score=122.55 TRINITY_DN2869_c0_g1_i1:1640-3166(-)